MTSSSNTRILAVASSGGHWVQLLRLRPAWRGLDVAYLTTEESYRHEIMNESDSVAPRLHICVAANRWQKLRLLRQLLKIALVVFRERPDVVCTTGAAPGYFALRLGKLLGARTIWIDSIANAETMSLAGIKAARHADIWLTQWEALTETEQHFGRSPEYWGEVL